MAIALAVGDPAFGIACGGVLCDGGTYFVDRKAHGLGSAAITPVGNLLLGGSPLGRSPLWLLLREGDHPLDSDLPPGLESS